MKIGKIIIGITIIFLLIGVAYAANNNEIFKAPSSLNKMAKDNFVDGQGHNIQISEDTDSNHKVWFENSTEAGYVVTPYEGNNSFYMYRDASETDPNTAEAVGVIEIVEKDGSKYIISSWSAKDTDSDFKKVAENLLEFNKLNNLKPIPIEG